MSRFVKWVVVTLLAVGILLAVSLSVLGHILLTPDRVERFLSQRSGRIVEIDGQVKLSLWGDVWLTISQLHLKNPPSSPFKHLATLESISVGLRWWDVLPSLLGSDPHFLDVIAGGGKVHVDSRQDVVGDDGVWPSADDPFTGMLSWINSLEVFDVHLEIKAGDEKVERIEIEKLHVVFGTGKKGAVIIDAVEMDLRVENVPLVGSLRLDAPIVTPGAAPPASLTGKLAISEMDLPALGAAPTGGKPNDAKERELPVHVCRSWETDIELSVAALRAKSVDVSEVSLLVTSSAGAWKIELKNAKFPAGHGYGEVSLRCGELPGQLVLESGIRSDGERRFGESGAMVDVLGRMESVLRLKGEGRTWQGLVGDLAGRFSVFLGPVQTDALEDRLYARSLFHALTVSWGQSGKAVVDCALLDMNFDKGVGRIEQVVVGTPTLVIDGKGSVDLVKNEVDVVLVPRAKHPSLGAVDVPVRISGGVEELHVGLDWVGVIPRLVIETGEAPFHAFPTTGLSKEEKEACRRSMEFMSPAPGNSKGKARAKARSG